LAVVEGALIDQTATAPAGSIEIYYWVVSFVFRLVPTAASAIVHILCCWSAIRHLFNLQREFPAGTSDLPTDPTSWAFWANKPTAVVNFG